MQFSKILSIFSLATAASATTGSSAPLSPPVHRKTNTRTVSYDVGYDDGNRPLTSVACSDGTNGLIWRYNW